MGVGMPVIENIPFSVYLHDASVIVCIRNTRHIRRLIGIYAQITVAYDHTTVFKGLIGLIRYSIAEFVVYIRRVYEIVFILYLPNGRSLEKGMSLIRRTLTVILTRRNEFGALGYGYHILSEYCHHGSVLTLITCLAESRIQIGKIPFRYNGGIKLLLVPFSCSEHCSLKIMYIAVEFIFSRRLVTHCHCHMAHFTE